MARAKPQLGWELESWMHAMPAQKRGARINKKGKTVETVSWFYPVQEEGKKKEPLPPFTIDAQTRGEIALAHKAYKKRKRNSDQVAPLALVFEEFVSELQDASRIYLWWRAYYDTVPSPAEEKVSLEEVIDYVTENNRLPPDLGEDMRETIVAVTMEVFQATWKQEPMKTWAISQPDEYYLNLFVAHKFIRDDAKASFSESYLESNVRRGGAPPNPSRRNFAIAIALILKKHNLHITLASDRLHDKDAEASYRGGLFFRVLKILFKAMGDVINDIRPLMKSARDFLEPKPPKIGKA